MENLKPITHKRANGDETRKENVLLRNHNRKLRIELNIAKLTIDDLRKAAKKQ